MKIVGCDFHPGWQQVAVFDAETGEVTEQGLVNGDGEAERLGHEVWVGNVAQIRASGACPELAEGCASRRPTSGMHRTGKVCLDKDFDLIEDTRRLNAEKNPEDVGNAIQANILWILRCAPFKMTLF